MPQEVLVNGEVYVFPDDATEEQISRSLKKMLAPPPTPARPAPALELPKAPGADVAPVGSLGGDPLAEAAEQRAAALEADVARQGLTPGSTYDTELARRQRQAAGQVTSLPVGSDRVVTEDTRYSFPTFRPTRIREVAEGAPDRVAKPAAARGREPEIGTEVEKLRARYRNLLASDLAPDVKERAQRLILDKLVTLGAVDALSEAELGRALLATAEDTPEFKKLTAESARRDKIRAEELKALPADKLAAAAQPPGVRPEGRRVYIDPFTGEAREPTAGEELTEAFAKQQKLSPGSANEAARRIEEVRKEVERRKLKGEDVGFADALTGGGPLFSGILSERGEDFRNAGVVETELGATLRSGLGTLSALAAEGYFGLLGYEVDENGVPLDPNDFGLAVATLRRSVGIPEVIEPMRLLPVGVVAGAVQKGLEATGFDDASAKLGDAVSAIPQLAYPAPGVATERTQRKGTTFDPEGQRRVSGIEVPSVLDDPAEFVDAEKRRLARNIASGRTLGDEFLDSPATRDYYRRVWGDEDAAYWAGSLGELLIPAGPGTLLRTGSKLGKAAAGSKAGVRAGEALISAAEAAKTPGASASGLRNLVLQPAADVAAALGKGEVADGRLARKLANKVLDDMNIDSTLRAEAKREIKGSSNSLEAITQDVSRALGRNSDDIRYFDNTLNRNNPGDMVLITDRVAVPRAKAAEWVAESKVIRQEALQKTNAELLGEIQTGLQRGSLSNRARAILTESEKIVRGSKGRFLTPAERAKVDRLLSQISPTLDLPPTARTASAVADDLARGSVTSQRIAEDIRAADAAGDSAALSKALGRAADDILERELMNVIPQEARLTRDLTAAQVAMRDLDFGLLAGPTSRRLQAAFGGLKRETIASARTARQLKAAGQGIIREVGKELSDLSRRAKSADRGMDELVFRRLDGMDPEEAWLKALEGIYGNPEVARAAMNHALADSANFGLLRGQSWVSPRGFLTLPEVGTLRAVDRSFAASGKAGLGSKLIGGRGGPGGFLAPDYQKSLLKLVVEEGLQKEVARLGMDSDILAGGIDVARGAEARIAADLAAATKSSTQAKTLEAALPTGPGGRIRVYDAAASDLERVLAEGGNELVQLAEGIEPRIRGPLIRMAADAVDWLTRGVGRNIEQMAKFGYILPNLPYIGWASAKPYLVSLVTEGLGGTSAAVKQQIARRATTGGGLYTQAGRYYSSEDLAQLAKEQGLGMSAVESTRVGSLSDDILRDARAAAERAKGPLRRYANLALDEANPMSKSLGQRIAESIEISFRQATFESKLIEGLSPNDAAEAARRAALDYGQAPEFVRSQLGRFFAEAAQDYALGAELVQLAKNNPAAARIFYKGQYLRSKAQDPYGTQGDAGLKSVFTIPVGENDYYVPGSEAMMAPVESALAIAKGGNLILGSLIRTAADAPQLGAGAGIQVVDGGARLIRTGIDAALPLIAQGIDAASAADGGGYQSTDVPSAPAMTDDAALWAAATVAHHLDPDRTGGDWARFTELFQPVWLNPPKGFQAYPDAKKDDVRSTYWSQQPPQGTPYLVWGTDPETNETIYKVFQPSEQGKANFALARKFPLASALEKGLIGTGIWFQSLRAPVVGAEGKEVRPGSMVPRIDPTATGAARGAAEALLGRVPTAEAERARQAAALLEGN